MMGMPRLTHNVRWVLPAVLLGMIVPGLAMAQGGGGLPVNETYEMIANWAVIAASFLNTMTWFVFVFLTQFLDPRFIFDLDPTGEEGALMGTLNAIWQLSRNIMNVGFAVGLVAAAIYTVVKGDREFVSNNLKKFILAVVLVNFSWFIPRVVLDVAHVAAAAIFSIPTAIVNEDAQCRYTSTTDRACIDPQPKDEEFTCACKALANFKPFPTPEEVAALDGVDAWECSGRIYCARYVKLDTTTSTAHGAILNGLIVNHARLPQLAMITRNRGDGGIGDLLMFILREFIVVAIHAAIFFPLVALLIALAIRIPILWLTMAFMPFYFLTFVIPDGMGLESVKKLGDDIKNWFLKAAFLPAAVAIPLSVGFIMANAGSRIEVVGLKDVGFNLIDGMGSFSQLLWVIMVLGILWTGTFTVLEMMTAEMPGGGAIKAIRNTGVQAGKFAAELPLSTVPIPGPGNLLNAAQNFGPSSLRRALRHRDGPAAGIGELFAPGSAERADTRRFANDLAGDANKKQDIVRAIENFNTDKNATRVRELTDALRAAGYGGRVNESNFDSVIQDLHRELRESHGQRLLSNNLGNDMERKFNDAVTSFRGGGGP